MDRLNSKVIDYAKEVYGLKISTQKKPDKYSWQNNTLYLEGREGFIFHEIGHYVVSSAIRRKLPDYGLYFYNANQLSYIYENRLFNNHTIEDGRAGVFGFYLSLYFQVRCSIPDTFFNPNYASPLSATGKIKSAVKWLNENKIIDNQIPTGKIFEGDWKLDDPMEVLNELAR